jgi:transcription elongation GreA/GreB family factor
VALEARSGDAALSAARAWAQDLPQSAEAQRFVLQILLALNRVGETGPVLRSLLERSSPAERVELLNELVPLFARVPDKARALAVVREALAGVLPPMGGRIERSAQAQAGARTAYAAAQSKGSIEADRTAMARATRDLRYWSARRASAQLTEMPADGRVRFGGSVTIEREDGRTQTWRIVGEDEADPAHGSVSHVSPLARALIGKRQGGEAVVAGQTVEVIAVDG